MKFKANYGINIILILLLLVQSSKAQQPQPIINASLTGVVLDSLTKGPLGGVTVQLEGVTHKVKTDIEGRFEFITGQKLPVTLLVSFVGYASKKLVVDRSHIVISLSRDRKR